MYNSTNALILVDIQNDFLPGGALAVPHGDEVIPVANQLMPHFELVVATQDWHPRDHASFADNHPGQQIGSVISVEGLDQIMWPVHCVQNTRGAEFADDLNVDRVSYIFKKGTDPRYDSYSGFFDNGHHTATGLGDFVKQRHVQRVFVLGLATDYCVKFTVLDALQLGFETVFIDDGCRGVNLNDGDVANAIETMRQQGADVRQSAQVLQETK